MPSPVSVSGGDVKAGPVSAPVIPLLLIGIGGYLAWFGVHYWRSDLKWPSDPVKSVLQGKGLPAAVPAPEETALLTAAVSQYQGGAGAGGGAYQGALPSGAAQNTAKLLLPKFGLAASEMQYLIPLWVRESDWSGTARNPQSGAFGVAQALGHGGTDTAAPDGTNEYGAQFGLTPAEARLANAGNIRWQIEWGLGYITAKPNPYGPTYGSAKAAWQHEQTYGWY